MSFMDGAPRSKRERAEMLIAVANEIAEETGGPFTEREIREARRQLKSTRR
jgi:hypothetical protein